MATGNVLIGWSVLGERLTPLQVGLCFALILFTACLGALWHDEALGPRRWACMTISPAAIAALALVGG